MVANSISKIIETTTAQLALQAGVQLGTKTSPVEAIVANDGNFYTSLAYAGFFFPSIRIVNGIPFATFPTAKTETPIDCVHVNLLHHSAASGNEPEVINALGLALANIWNQNLTTNSIPGRFIYDNSEGYDVIYQP